jgi:carboxymethylenebutenolidase
LRHGGKIKQPCRIAWNSVRDQAYFVTAPSGLGPGVLLLPAWWGLTAAVRRRADRVADAGFTVLAPDMALGTRPSTEEEAETMLADADPNRLASLVSSSAGLLAEKATPGPIGVMGYGMGGSLGLWLSVRQPDRVAAAVSFYGSQVIDFAGAAAAYQIHLAERDRYISDDEAAFMEATMGLEALDATVHIYPGTEHGFADPDSPAYHDQSAELAFERAVVFLQDRL